MSAEQSYLESWTSRERNDAESIMCTFKFANFADALTFVNKVGELAEAANHHPDIELGWGYATIWLTTHSEGGVTDKDHELATKIDQLTD